MTLSIYGWLVRRIVALWRRHQHFLKWWWEYWMTLWICILKYLLRHNSVISVRSKLKQWQLTTVYSCILNHCSADRWLHVGPLTYSLRCKNWWLHPSCCSWHRKRGLATTTLCGKVSPLDDCVLSWKTKCFLKTGLFDTDHWIFDLNLNFSTSAQKFEHPFAEEG